MSWLYRKLMLWYWTRYYNQRMLDSPDAPELLEMAQKTGKVREYHAYLEQLKLQKLKEGDSYE